MNGELFVRWTIRLSLLCYASVIVGRMAIAARALSASAVWTALGRWFWTLGAILALVHILAAFGVYHHWSHAEAVAATAQQTAAVVGLEVGAGVYFNYLFILIWFADAALWWKSGAHYLWLPRWWIWPVQGYLFFMAVNGAIVFETGPTRWGGIAALALFVILGVVYAVRFPLLHSRPEN